MKTLLCFVPLLALACTDGAPNAQRSILRDRVPRIKEILQQDREKHWVGIQTAARRLAPGFAVEDAGSRERQMRSALRTVQQPPRGIAQFIASPMTFLAAVGKDGVVIARDTTADQDKMKGDNFGERFSVVRQALDGDISFGLMEFEPPDDAEEGAQSSYSMMYAAPARHGGEIVGAVVLGIPLWREAQRFSRQLRVELAQQLEQDGLVVWVYMYKGAEIRYLDTPPELDELVPGDDIRQAGLSRSPGGFTGQLQLLHSWYGYGVIPTPTIGDDVGFIVFQSEKGSPKPEAS